MTVTRADALRALEQATAMARLITVDLDADYLRAIAWAEARAENSPGTDKTWVSTMDAAFRRHYRSARPG